MNVEDSLPCYEESQRQIVKAMREAYYMEYSAKIRAAECAYDGSTGLRLPPESLISYVLRKAYRVKKNVVTSFTDESRPIETDQTQTILVPGYTHLDQPDSLIF